MEAPQNFCEILKFQFFPPENFKHQIVKNPLSRVRLPTLSLDITYFPLESFPYLIHLSFLVLNLHILHLPWDSVKFVMPNSNLWYPVHDSRVLIKVKFELEVHSSISYIILLVFLFTSVFLPYSFSFSYYNALILDFINFRHSVLFTSFSDLNFWFLWSKHKLNMVLFFLQARCSIKCLWEIWLLKVTWFWFMVEMIWWLCLML